MSGTLQRRPIMDEKGDEQVETGERLQAWRFVRPARGRNRVLAVPETWAVRGRVICPNGQEGRELSVCLCRWLVVVGEDGDDRV
jgi:hypothetical protein